MWIKDICDQYWFKRRRKVTKYLVSWRNKEIELVVFNARYIPRERLLDPPGPPLLLSILYMDLTESVST